jgi:hypothetical protein
VPLAALQAVELARAIQAALVEARSFHVEMDMGMTGTTQGLTLKVPFELAGDYQYPDRMKGKFSASLFGFVIESEFVQIGPTSWVKDPQTGKWQKSTSESGVAPFNPDDFLGDEFLSGDDAPVTALSVVGLEVLDGTEVWHYAAMIPASRLDLKGGELKFDMYVGAQDRLPRKLTMKGEVDLGAQGTGAAELPVPTGPAKFDLTMTLSKFGVPVEISPP